MDNGKLKCDTLRRIRQDIAKRYNIAYSPIKCNHIGKCLGTCHICEEELSYLQEQLDKLGISNIDLTIPIDAIQENDSRTTSKDKNDFILTGIPAPPLVDTRNLVTIIKGVICRPCIDIENITRGTSVALIPRNNNDTIAVVLKEQYQRKHCTLDICDVIGYIPKAYYKRVLRDIDGDTNYDYEISHVKMDSDNRIEIEIDVYLNTSITL